MSNISRTLGQANPGSTLTALYTATNVTASATVYVCNTGIFNETYSVSVAIGGAADATSQYLAYEVAIGSYGKDSVVGIYLRPGDVIRVTASDPAVTFTAIGTEQN